MPVEVSCPGCGLRLKVPDTLAGKKAKCSKCNGTFAVPGAAAPPPAVAVNPPAARPPANVGALPSADPFDFDSPPAAKPKTPAASAPAAKPAFGAAKAPPPAAASAPAAKPAFGAAKAPPAAPVAPAAKPPAAKPPAAKSPPQAQPEPLPLDDESQPAAAPAAAAAADPFAFDAAAPAPKAEKPRAKKGQPRDEAEDEKPKAKKGRDDDEDDDPKPQKKQKAAGAAPAEPDQGDLFGFTNDPEPEPAARPEKAKKKKDEDDDEDDPKQKKKRKPDDDEEPEQTGRRYVRPAEQKSSKTLLLAGVIGAAALGGSIFAVITYIKRDKEIEAARAAAAEKKAAEKKGDDQAPPVVDPPPDTKGGTAKKDPPEKKPKDPPAKKPDDPAPKPEPGAVMLAFPATMKPFPLRGPGSKLEPQEKPTGNPVPVEAPVAKVKALFTPTGKDHDIVVVWESNAGFNGKGQQLAVDIFSPVGSKVAQFKYDGEGKDVKCDVSPDGKRFAAVGADGKVSVWTLADQKKTLDGFDPGADKDMGDAIKKHGLAAVFFTANPAHLVFVSTAGQVYLFDAAQKKKIESTGPVESLVTGRVVLGRNVAADETRTSVVMGIGKSIYQFDTATMTTASKIVLDGEVGRPLGIASFGVPGKIAYAFETNPPAPETKDKAVLFCLPKEKPVFQKWPDSAGDPTGAAWAGQKFAVIPTTKGAVYWESEGKKFTPLGLAEVAGGKGLHVANDNGHWYLVPHPSDANKSLLLVLSTDALGDFGNAVEGKDPPTVRLDEKGISR